MAASFSPLTSTSIGSSSRGTGHDEVHKQPGAGNSGSEDLQGLPVAYAADLALEQESTGTLNGSHTTAARSADDSSLPVV